MTCTQCRAASHFALPSTWPPEFLTCLAQHVGATQQGACLRILPFEAVGPHAFVRDAHDDFEALAREMGDDAPR